MNWTAKHDEAIKKTHKSLQASLKDCQSRLDCQKTLKAEGWPHGLYNEFGPVSEVVQKVMANRAILERCRELMTR